MPSSDAFDMRTVDQDAKQKKKKTASVSRDIDKKKAPPQDDLARRSSSSEDGRRGGQREIECERDSKPFARARASVSVSEAKETMRRTVDQTMARGERLDDLLAASSSLQEKSKSFERFADVRSESVSQPRFTNTRSGSESVRSESVRFPSLFSDFFFSSLRLR